MLFARTWSSIKNGFTAIISWIVKNEIIQSLYLLLVIAIIVSATVIIFAILWEFDVNSTSNILGFKNKTFWDWGALLIVPIILILIANLYSRSAEKREREVSQQNQWEETLQSYFDHMEQLLLNNAEQLFNSSEGNPTKQLAQSRTITTLRRLNASRINVVLGFLSRTGLITVNNSNRIPIIKLSNTWLGYLNLSGEIFLGAILDTANLRNGSLRYINFKEANLRGAYLENSNLEYSDLENADLRWSKLEGVNLFNTNLKFVNLANATFNGITKLPNGKLWKPDTDMAIYTNPDHESFWRSDDPLSPAYNDPDSRDPDLPLLP